MFFYSQRILQAIKINLLWNYYLYYIRLYLGSMKKLRDPAVQTVLSPVFINNSLLGPIHTAAVHSNKPALCAFHCGAIYSECHLHSLYNSVQHTTYHSGPQCTNLALWFSGLLNTLLCVFQLLWCSGSTISLTQSALVKTLQRITKV